MGVQNLWKVLEKGNAVVKLKGDTQFQQIVDAVENKVVAVDLSAWLMQAQTQPALLANYDSPYARAVKVVFDRTVHWLRHGCLPVFVIEGQTPQAKLDKLRHRCISQYGPQRRFDVGNRAGGQFDKLGQSVKKLLDLLGVPCVQAVGEGEAMCAALNICGWAHACHTLDVDALLFGAITVYRSMHLATDKTKEAELTICRREDVQRILGISSGGNAALTAVAQLAGGDYDLTGVENVGEVLALAAVRHLLRNCQNDDTVLQKLEAAIAAGSNPELDALKHCTGCKACGHESGTGSTIKQHPAKRGCVACGCASGCAHRRFTACECEFHIRAEERLLNRVVKLAEQTPGFAGKCRLAADTYQEQLRLAISAVQREYGLAQPNSEHNVFRWMHRPDVRKISDFMCKYISDWDHHQVRLKLLPVLLEWDVRQGPQPNRFSGVQFRPTSIRQVSTRGAGDMKDAPRHERQGWRYILDVKRLTSSSSSGSQQQYPDDWAAEDLAIDQAWLDNTARSRPKQQHTAGGIGPGASIADDEEETYIYSQGVFAASQATQQQGFDSYTEGVSSSQAAAGGSIAVAGASSGGGRSGSRAAGSLQFAEHRSVRCTLVDSLWPELTDAFRNPPATSGRAKKSGGGRKKVAPAAADYSAQQRSLKDFFGTTKDPRSGARAGGKPGDRLPAGRDGSIIPGLAGITAGCGTAVSQEQGLHLSSKGAAGSELSGQGAASALGAPHRSSSSVKQRQTSSGQGFMDWLNSHIATNGEEVVASHRSTMQAPPQADPFSCSPGAAIGAEPPSSRSRGGATQFELAASVDTSHGLTDATGGSSMNQGSPKRSAAASGCTRGVSRQRHSKLAGGGMPAGALDRFMQKPMQQQRQQSSQLQQQPSPGCQGLQQQQQQEQGPHEVLQPLRDGTQDTADVCDSPDALPLAARLARGKAASSRPIAEGSQAAASPEPAAGGRQVLVPKTSATATAFHWDALSMPRPAKKASTWREKERLCSPLNSPEKPQGLASNASSPHHQQQQQPRPDQHNAAEVLPTVPAAYSKQYLALMHEVGVLSPPRSVQAGKGSPSRAVQRLFSGQHGQCKHDGGVINLLDSPEAVATLPHASTGAGSSGRRRFSDVIDLT